jgi:hypothetical protein
MAYDHAQSFYNVNHFPRQVVDAGHRPLQRLQHRIEAGLGW